MAALVLVVSVANLGSADPDSAEAILNACNGPVTMSHELWFDIPIGIDSGIIHRFDSPDKGLFLREQQYDKGQGIGYWMHGTTIFGDCWMVKPPDPGR